MLHLVYRRTVHMCQCERRAPSRATLAFAILTLAFGACTDDNASVGASADPEAEGLAIRLYTLDCGRIEINDLALFDRGGAYDGRQASVADPCFLIRHPRGDLLWDTGVADALAREPNGVAFDTNRFSMPRTLKGQLAELGLGAEDIEYVALSHSHFDHVGNAGDYASATWLVDATEREFMFSEEARSNAQTFPYYSALESADTVTFTDDHDVFGDGAVLIVRTPGHTPGHSALLVRLTKSGSVLLSGDLYHLAEARTRRTIPVFNTDAEETLRSMDKFESLAASIEARIVIQHEPEHFAALPVPPAFLD